MKTHVQGIPVADVAARVHHEYKRIVDNAFNAAIDNVAREMQTDPDWVREAAERDTRIPRTFVTDESGYLRLGDCTMYGERDTFDCWGRHGTVTDNGEKYVQCEGHFNGKVAGR